MPDLAYLKSLNWVGTLLSGLALSLLGSLLKYLVQEGFTRSYAAYAARRAAKLQALQTAVQSPVELTMTLVDAAVKTLLCFILATAISTLAVFPNPYMSDRVTVILLVVGTLLYLTSMLLGVDMLRTVWDVRYLQSSSPSPPSPDPGL
jgi:hypothetical protein